MAVLCQQNQIGPHPAFVFRGVRQQNLRLIHVLKTAEHQRAFRGRFLRKLPEKLGKPIVWTTGGKNRRKKGGLRQALWPGGGRGAQQQGVAVFSGPVVQRRLLLYGQGLAGVQVGVDVVNALLDDLLELENLNGL